MPVATHTWFNTGEHAPTEHSHPRLLEGETTRMRMFGRVGVRPCQTRCTRL